MVVETGTQISNLDSRSWKVELDLEEKMMWQRGELVRHDERELKRRRNGGMLLLGLKTSMELFQELWKLQTAIKQYPMVGIRMLIPFPVHPALVCLGELQQSEV
jgi:hypothetical protein